MTLMLDRPVNDANGDGKPPAPNGVTHPHAWIGSATISLTPKLAKHAELRGSFRTSEQGLRVDVLEVYCSACRRRYDDVVLRGRPEEEQPPCEARINNEHLIGGNPGERKKRSKAARGETVTVSPAVRGPRMAVAPPPSAARPRA